MIRFGLSGWRVVVVVLAATNAVMAVSQTNIASLYLGISSYFHSSLLGLGVLASVYFAGYGLVELPGGITASRLGPKRLIVSGGLLTTFSLLGCALSPSFVLLTIFRIFAGAGYGLVFAPILVLLIRNLGNRQVGLGAALGTISFGVGGSAGIYFWSILSNGAGWRVSLLVEFAISLCTVALLIFLVPDDKTTDPKVSWRQLRVAFTDKSMVALCLTAFGGAATANLTGSFIVYYLENVFRVAPADAGLIGAVSYFAPLITCVAAGRLYDRGFSVKRLLGIAAISISLGTAVLVFNSVLATVVGVIVAGLASGVGGTLDFSVARDLSVKPELESLNVGIVDLAMLVGLFVSPLLFSVVVVNAGYPSAWLIGSLPAMIFFAPLLTVKIEKRRKKQKEDTSLMPPSSGNR
jgi:predicted MFS family arabinose efflux permease